MQPNFPWKRIAILGVELFFGINVILLDILIFTQSHTATTPLTAQNIQNIPTPTPTLEPVPSLALSPTSTPLVQHPIVQTNSSIKEIFIPLGSGQTDQTDWTDIPGALGYIDGAAYPGIKKAVLEATVTIPNGNETASVRLFNKTDGHPVWYSETAWSGGSTQLVISQPFSLDTGSKLYQVQVKNQLPSEAVISNARIHITLQ